MKDAILWAGVVVGTSLVALGSVWPFLNAWQLHDTPAFVASHDWAQHSHAVAELTGPNSHFESDWFPTGGAKDGHARFEHKLEGDKGKVEVGVILEEHEGHWVVTRAAKKTDDGEYEDLDLD